jgi:hypothetical protein
MSVFFRLFEIGFSNPVVRKDWSWIGCLRDVR